MAEGGVMVHVEATQLIRAPREAVFQLIDSVEGLARFEGEMRDIRIESSQGNTVVASLRVRAPLGNRSAQVRFTFQPPASVAFQYIKGPFKSLVESYELETVPEGTKVTHTADTELPIPLLGDVVGRLLRGLIRAHHRREVETLKMAAEGG